MPSLSILQIYLLVINVVAFLVCSAALRGSGGPRGDDASHGALGLLTLFGAPVGVLLACLVWDPRMRKAHVALVFEALCMLVVWALVAANVYGWHRFDVDRLRASLTENHATLWLYLAAVNAITLVLFCVDKARAKAGGWRVREAVLLGFSFIGGALGGLLGMHLAHHKVRTYYFRFGLPVMLLIELAAVAYLLQAGIV